MAAISDQLAIGQQVARYAQYWDRKSADDFVTLFTPEGLMERYVAGALHEASVVRGRDQILEYAKASHSGRLAGRQSRHHFSNLVFEQLTSRTARTEHTFVVTHQLPGQAPVMMASGFYRIDWRKMGNVWLIDQRKLYVDR